MTPQETMAILAKYKEQNPQGFESFQSSIHKAVGVNDFESLATIINKIQLEPAATTVEHEQSFPLNIIRTVSAGNGAQIQNSAGASAHRVWRLEILMFGIMAIET